MAVSIRKIAIALLFLVCSAVPISISFAQNADRDMQYIRVGLLQNQQQVSISADDDFMVKDTSHDKNYKFNRNKTVQIVQKKGSIYIDKKNSKTQSVIVAVKNNALVSVNGRKYRGALLLQLEQNGLRIINRLQIDDYLRGVVPNEMPIEWDSEALKAQAVAARSYALYDKMDGKHAGEGFDVCTTNHCQVYGGAASEKAASDRAINDTRGIVLTYKNNPICAVFHAASGGSTENSEDVWGSVVPYLRAVDDAAERSPYMIWTEKVSADKLNNMINGRSGNIGTLKAIDTTLFKQQIKASAKGKYVRFIGSKKSVNIKGAELRSMLGLKSSNFTLSLEEKGKVKSSSQLKLNDVKDAEIVIEGRGFGHRLGMSQWGAKSLADKGQNYRQILLHYYSDVQLKQLY